MTGVIRKATLDDAPLAGQIVHHFQQSTLWMPKLYSLDEVTKLCRTMIERDWVTVNEHQGRMVGFLARDRTEVCSLYLADDVKGQGFGRALLAEAKLASPELVLRTFEANMAARRFYHRQGFIEIGRGDGSKNDEGLPDVFLHWARDEQLGEDITE